METNTILATIFKNISEYFDKSELGKTYVKLSPTNGKLVVINNSFFFREKTYIKTNKNNNYLALKPSDDGRLGIDNCLVVEGVQLNKNYQVVNDDDARIKDIRPLGQAVESELNLLGDLVFILLGEVDDSVAISADIDHSKIHKVILDPTQVETVIIEGDNIICRSLEDEKAIWDKLKEMLESSYGYTSEDFSELEGKLGTAFDKLKAKAYCKLILPSIIESTKPYFIDIVIESLKKNLLDYQNALKLMTTTSFDREQAYTEVLRIAYNFTDDAITLIRLLVSICDLKPLILWGTFASQYLLVENISHLPWSRQVTKPSLSGYIQTIRKARNQTFHRLFPFTKPFEITLPDEALKDVRLRIFSEFGSRKNTNRIQFEDKELVDLLMEFNRTAEELVHDDFWEKNAKVMEATVQMISEISDFLKMCFNERQKMSLR